MKVIVIALIAMLCLAPAATQTLPTGIPITTKAPSDATTTASPVATTTASPVATTTASPVATTTASPVATTTTTPKTTLPGTIPPPFATIDPTATTASPSATAAPTATTAAPSAGPPGTEAPPTAAPPTPEPDGTKELKISLTTLENQGLGESPQAPSIDFLGRGYHALYGNPYGTEQSGELDPGFRSPVLEVVMDQARTCLMNKYMCPYNATLTKTQICEVNSVCTEVDSLESYRNQLSADAKLSATLGKGSISGSFSSSVSWSKESERQEKLGLQSYDAKALCTEYSAGFNTYQEHVLAENFLEGLKTLPGKEFNIKNPAHVAAFDRFVSAFGTEVVWNVEFGAKRIRRTFMKTKFVSELSKYKLSVSAAFGFSAGAKFDNPLDKSDKCCNAVNVNCGDKAETPAAPGLGGSISLSGSFSQSQDLYKELAQKTEYVKDIWIGGTPSTDFTEWMASIPERVVPIRYELRPLAQFIPDLEKRQSFLTYLDYFVFNVQPLKSFSMNPNFRAGLVGFDGAPIAPHWKAGQNNLRYTSARSEAYEIYVREGVVSVGVDRGVYQVSFDSLGLGSATVATAILGSPNVYTWIGGFALFESTEVPGSSINNSFALTTAVLIDVDDAGFGALTGVGYDLASGDATYEPIISATIIDQTYTDLFKIDYGKVVFKFSFPNGQVAETPALKLDNPKWSWSGSDWTTKPKASWGAPTSYTATYIRNLAYSDTLEWKDLIYQANNKPVKFSKQIKISESIGSGSATADSTGQVEVPNFGQPKDRSFAFVSARSIPSNDTSGDYDVVSGVVDQDGESRAASLGTCWRSYSARGEYGVDSNGVYLDPSYMILDFSDCFSKGSVDLVATPIALDKPDTVGLDTTTADLSKKRFYSPNGYSASLRIVDVLGSERFVISPAKKENIINDQFERIPFSFIAFNQDLSDTGVIHGYVRFVGTATTVTGNGFTALWEENKKRVKVTFAKGVNFVGTPSASATFVCGDALLKNYANAPAESLVKQGKLPSCRVIESSKSATTKFKQDQLVIDEINRKYVTFVAGADQLYPLERTDIAFYFVIAGPVVN